MTLLRYGHRPTFAMTPRQLRAAAFSVLLLAPLALAQEGIVQSIVKAPIVFDGTVTGAATDFVINLDTSLDPMVPGRSLAAGDTIRISLPPEFQNTGDLPFAAPGTSEDCAPGNVQCNTGVLLQGWPQHPIAPPAQKYAISYEAATNSIVFTALEDLAPAGSANPGIKQIHLILIGFTNPAPGFYPVEVASQTGPDGDLETGVGTIQILSEPRPAVNVTSAMNEGTPNTIYQQAEAGEFVPLPYDLLLWGAGGTPLEGVTIDMVSAGSGVLKQGEWVVGQVFVEAPAGASGFELTHQAPSQMITAPVLGVPTAHLRVVFRTGSDSGPYRITFVLDGGNALQTFVTVR